jgi:hypothetical protein
MGSRWLERGQVLANKMIVTRAGEWMLPYWREKGECETEAKEYAAVLVSADHGATWKTRGMIFQQKTWLIENSLVETRGALIMYFRCALACIIITITHTCHLAAFVALHLDRSAFYALRAHC